MKVTLPTECLQTLNHLAWFRMGTVASAAKSTELPLAEQKGVFRRLAKMELVTSVEFPVEDRFYQLTAKACRHLDIHSSYARPLGGQAIVERWAILWACCLSDTDHRRCFNPATEPETFPLVPKRVAQPYFFIDEQNEVARLGYYFIDFLGPEFRNRIIQKVGRLVTWLPDWFQAQALRFVVLTAHDQRRRELEAALPSVFVPLPFEVVVVPGMIQLIPASRHGAHLREERP